MGNNAEKYFPGAKRLERDEEGERQPTESEKLEGEGEPKSEPRKPKQESEKPPRKRKTSSRRRGSTEAPQESQEQRNQGEQEQETSSSAQEGQGEQEQESRPQEQQPDAETKAEAGAETETETERKTGEEAEVKKPEASEPEKPEQRKTIKEKGIEEIRPPWEQERRKQEERLISDYLEEDERKIEKETREKISRALQEEADQKNLEFARQWFSSHRREIKDRGYDIQSQNPSYILEVVKEMRGFDDLRTEQKYEEINRDIENLFALMTDVKKQEIPLDSRFLMLNAFNKAAERIKKELEQARESGEEAGIAEKERKLEELFGIRQELAGNIGKEDLRKNAEIETEILADKEEYVAEHLDRKAQEKINAEQYITEERGFLWWKKFIVLDARGEEVEEFRTQAEVSEFIQRMYERMREETKHELEEEWQNKNKTREEKIKEKIDAAVMLLGKSPEKARQGIEAVYQRVKDRLLVEFMEKRLKKGEKTKEQLEAIKQEFGSDEGEARDATELIDEVLHRREGLEDLTGDPDEDRKALGKFAGRWGYEMPDSFDTAGYSEAAKKQKGFLEWMIDFLFSLTGQPAQEKK